MAFIIIIIIATNTIAIEGHNSNLDSTDFTLHPSVIIKKPTKK